MKKTILTVAALTFLGASSLFAQVSVGPKIGLNISNIHDKAVSDTYDEEDFKSRVGFHVGGMLNAQLSDYFAIRPELLYTTAGGKLEYPGVDVKMNYGYLSLPVNFVGSLPISDDFKVQGILGAYLSYGLGGKLKVEGSGATVENDIKMAKKPDEINDNFYLNPLDFGLNFGVGAQYKSLVFSATYGLGLTNLESHYANSAMEDERGKDSKMYNRNFSIGVAYLFGGN